MSKDQTKASFEEACRQYEQFIGQYPLQVEAIFHLTSPTLFTPEQSVVVKEVPLPPYGTRVYPLDLKYYKQVSRLLSKPTIEKLKQI